MARRDKRKRGVAGWCPAGGKSYGGGFGNDRVKGSEMDGRR